MEVKEEIERAREDARDYLEIESHRIDIRTRPINDANAIGRHDESGRSYVNDCYSLKIPRSAWIARQSERVTL